MIRAGMSNGFFIHPVSLPTVPADVCRGDGKTLRIGHSKGTIPVGVEPDRDTGTTKNPKRID